MQLATNSSGGIAASWNTVSPIYFAPVISWVNVSFQHGSNVFAFVVERSEKLSNYLLIKYEFNVHGRYLSKQKKNTMNQTQNLFYLCILAINKVDVIELISFQ